MVLGSEAVSDHLTLHISVHLLSESHSSCLSSHSAQLGLILCSNWCPSFARHHAPAPFTTSIAMSAAAGLQLQQQFQQQLQRPAAANKRTGRPKRLQPPPQSFPPLPPTAQPQPVELACLAYHYLRPLFPKTAESLLSEAAGTLPALGLLVEQSGGVRLENVVGEWMRGKQKEWEERRLVKLLDGLEQQQQQQQPADEQKDGSSNGRSSEGAGLVQRTVTTLLQLLTDYSTLRQTEEKVSQPLESHSSALSQPLSIKACTNPAYHSP